jgi:serine/threonine protein kinase
MELVSGGELFDRIVNKGFYTEKDAKEIMADILGAIKYLHDQNIVHRDLKPENLLMGNDKDDADIKLADFGLATVAEKDNILKTSCGTLTYVAPEILRKEKYGRPVDMWALGVITYILYVFLVSLTGKVIGLSTLLGRRRLRDFGIDAQGQIQVLFARVGHNFGRGQRFSQQAHCCGSR